MRVRNYTTVTTHDTESSKSSTRSTSVCNITRVTPKLDTAISNIQGMVTDLNLYGCYGRYGYWWMGKSPWQQKIMRTQLV